VTLAAGDRDAADAAAGAVELLGRSGQTLAMPGIVALCRGMVETDQGLLLEAVETLRNSARPLDLAVACEAAAAVLAANGEAERAGALQNEAISTYESFGAQRDVLRVAGSIRVAHTQRRRAKPARPVTGWGSLSPTENRVVALVAEGLSNAAVAERMFISHRTVETHLTHIFRKVGATSRVELALRASRELER
jgi:DNA-binding CsgD family transcriptional regulator